MCTLILSPYSEKELNRPVYYKVHGFMKSFFSSTKSVLTDNLFTILILAKEYSIHANILQYLNK